MARTGVFVFALGRVRHAAGAGASAGLASQVCHRRKLPSKLSTVITEPLNALSTHECPFTQRAHTHRGSMPLKSRPSNTSPFRPPRCIALAPLLPMVSFAKPLATHHTLRRLLSHGTVRVGVCDSQARAKGAGSNPVTEQPEDTKTLYASVHVPGLLIAMGPPLSGGVLCENDDGTCVAF